MYFTKKVLSSLHTNQRLLIEELLKYGVEVFPIDLSIELIEARYKGHQEYILDRFCSNVPLVSAKMTADKILTKRVLQQHNIPTPKGEVFDPDKGEKALQYAKSELTFPVVIKPNWGSHGDYIKLDVETPQELLHQLSAFLKETEGNMPFIIEEQFFGEEFRIFIAINGEYAVLHRERPFVIGNGKDTIETLVADESYRRTHPRTNSLCPILIDPVFLEKQELHFSSIPKSGKKVYVRNTSNVAKGGYSHNMTALVHPSIIAQATKILEIFRGLPYLGIDFMCNDITKEQIGNSYTIVEVNVNPGVAMHMLPGDNDAVNVANILVKLMFPEIFS